MQVGNDRAGRKAALRGRMQRRLQVGQGLGSIREEITQMRHVIRLSTIVSATLGSLLVVTPRAWAQG
jgi:hypothetical protein